MTKPNGDPGSMNRLAAVAQHRAAIAARKAELVTRETLDETTNTPPVLLTWDQAMEQMTKVIPFGRSVYTPDEEAMNLLCRRVVGSHGGIIYRVYKRAMINNLKEIVDAANQ